MIPTLRQTVLAYDATAPMSVDVRVQITGALQPDGSVAVRPGTAQLNLRPENLQPGLPLISCLMVTKQRLDQAKISIGCYRRQTWPNRELIVIDQNTDGALAAWITSLNDPTIRLHAMPGLSEPLGSIRNRSVALAKGELLCVWDDDDIHHPARIELEAAVLLAAKTKALVLTREMFWVPQAHRFALRRSRYYCNSLLVWRDAGLRYPPLARAEDLAAVNEIMGNHPVVIADLPELYLYISHGSNTWDAGYMDRQWNAATDRLENEAADLALATLPTAFPIADYRAALDRRIGVA
jgi:glycosyltransferase involved in cell wall biosynthesis